MPYRETFCVCVRVPGDKGRGSLGYAGGGSKETRDEEGTEG